MRKAVPVLFPLLLLAIAPVYAQQADFSKVEIKVQKVSGTVYMLEGLGGNIGASIGEDGIVIVDDEFLPLADKIEAALPVITFDNDVSVHLNGEDIRAIHIPNGHTDGDAVIFFPKANVVHMGDDFFNGGRFPFIDLDSGGSVQGMISGDEKILAEVPDGVKIIPGHGPLASKDDLRKFMNMLKETSAAVQDGIKQGKTLDQLKKDKVLAKWDSYGQSSIKTDVFTEIL